MAKTYEIKDGILYEVTTTIEKRSVSTDALKDRKIVLQAEMDGLDADIAEIEAEEAKLAPIEPEPEPETPPVEEPPVEPEPKL